MAGSVLLSDRAIGVECECRKEGLGSGRAVSGVSGLWEVRLFVVAGLCALQERAPVHLDIYMQIISIIV